MNLREAYDWHDHSRKGSKAQDFSMKQTNLKILSETTFPLTFIGQ